MRTGVIGVLWLPRIFFRPHRLAHSPTTIMPLSLSLSSLFSLVVLSMRLTEERRRKNERGGNNAEILIETDLQLCGGLVCCLATRERENRESVIITSDLGFNQGRTGVKDSRRSDKRVRNINWRASIGTDFNRHRVIRNGTESGWVSGREGVCGREHQDEEEE